MAKAKRARTGLQSQVYDRHAELCKVLSHPIRLQVLNTLRARELSVSELASRLGVSIGNLSQHLNMMKQRRVVVSRKQGNSVYYRLTNPKMLKAFDLIREILFEQMRFETVLIRHIRQG